MESYSFIPHRVCSRKITFDLEDGKIYNLHFEGGCPGICRPSAVFWKAGMPGKQRIFSGAMTVPEREHPVRISWPLRSMKH